MIKSSSTYTLFSFSVLYYKTYLFSKECGSPSMSQFVPKFTLRSLSTPLFPYSPTAHPLHHVFFFFPLHFFLPCGFSTFWLDLKEDACQEVGFLLQLPILISSEGARFFFYFWSCSIRESGYQPKSFKYISQANVHTTPTPLFFFFMLIYHFLKIVWGLL